MKNYAEIIDKGECRSTLNSFFVNGVLANRDQWARYNFYPQNGQVGELIEYKNGQLEYPIQIHNICIYTLVLKINDDIYVPITKNGIKYISENEYRMKIGNNSFSNSMNKKQKEINNNYDRYQSGINGLHFAPGAYHDAFWSDICQILKKHTNNFTNPMYHDGLVQECLMYTLDMCRHFQRLTGEIEDKRKEYIAMEVCSVFEKHFKEFTYSDKQMILRRINEIYDFEFFSSNIDAFYK